MHTLRAPGSNVTVHWDQTQFWVKDDPDIDNIAAEYDPELGQSEAHYLSHLQKLTKFWVTFDLELGPIPMDPFFSGLR